MKKQLRKVMGTSKRITEDLHHKCKVISRKRDLMKIKMDVENGCYEQHLDPNQKPTHYPGYKPKKEVDSWGIAMSVIFYLLISTLLYVVVITIIDLWK